MTIRPTSDGGHIYLEAALQDRFIAMFRRKRGYEERFHDREAKGAPFDSYGLIGERSVLIEFKHTLFASDIRFQPDRTGSIERKIAAALRSIHDEPPTGPAATLAGRATDLEPLLVIVASKLSLAARWGLKALLEERAPAWGFGWEIHEGAENAQPLDAREAASLHHLPDIPILRDKPPRRRRPPSLEQFRTSFTELSVGPLFERFCALLAASGGRLVDRNQRNVNFGFILPDGRRKAMLGAYLDHSSAMAGLNIGFKKSAIETRLGGLIDNEILPGHLAPRTGYWESNRYLRSIEEIEQFCAALAGRQPEGAEVGVEPAFAKETVA